MFTLLNTDMYANFKSGIAFLTTMIQKADGCDVSGPREELIELLNEQITLAEKLLAESLKKEKELGELFPGLVDHYENTYCEKVHQKILQCQNDMDEVDRKAFLYLNDLKLLRDQKKLQVFAKNSSAIEALTDEMENLTGSDLSLALDKQIGLINDQIPLVEDFYKQATEEGS